MKIAIIILLMSAICYGSESPQRDLYKIDARDWYFNNQGDYAINQPELKSKDKGSDGERLQNELNQQIKKHKRGKGDDFYCSIEEVSHWREIPELEDGE